MIVSEKKISYRDKKIIKEINRSIATLKKDVAYINLTLRNKELEGERRFELMIEKKSLIDTIEELRYDLNTYLY